MAICLLSTIKGRLFCIFLYLETVLVKYHWVRYIVLANFTKHHSAWIESTAVKKSTNSRVFSEDWFMIRSKRFWSTDGGLDADLFEARNSIDGALDVNAENVPIKFVKTKSEISLNLKIIPSTLSEVYISKFFNNNFKCLHLIWMKILSLVKSHKFSIVKEFVSLEYV